MTPFSQWSRASPIFADSLLTVPAATPRCSSISRAAIPAFSLPTPASLKKTAPSRCSQAKPPELTPPCEADTTIWSVSPSSTCVMESMMITLRPSNSATVSLAMRCPRFVGFARADRRRAVGSGPRPALVFAQLDHYLDLVLPLVYPAEDVRCLVEADALRYENLEVDFPPIDQHCNVLEVA